MKIFTEKEEYTKRSQGIKDKPFFVISIFTADQGFF